jgi:hypothetical protein
LRDLDAAAVVKIHFDDHVEERRVMHFRILVREQVEQLGLMVADILAVLVGQGSDRRIDLQPVAV